MVFRQRKFKEGAGYIDEFDDGALGYADLRVEDVDEWDLCGRF